MTNLANDRREVSRLKELLFKEERRLLSTIERVVHEHDRRIGNDEALQHSVAEVLAQALREADVKDHRDLAASISPVIVAAIKREIARSRDEMVEALYPILGRLASSYVSSAFRDFLDGMKRRLAGRLRGRPCVDEVLLVRKESSLLIEHWRASAGGAEASAESDEPLLKRLLAAINNFAAKAFARENQALRSLDIGKARLYIRSSPAHLLAVKCVGRPSWRFEKDLDGALIDSLERQERALAQNEPAPAQGEAGGKATASGAILAELAADLNTALAQEKPAPTLAWALAGLLALAAAGFFGWRYEEAYLTAQLRNRAREAVSAQAELRGFPIEVEAPDDRSRVVLTGLTSSREAAEAALAAVAEAVKPVTVESRLAYVPTSQRLEAVENSFKSFASGVEARMESLATGTTARIERVAARDESAREEEERQQEKRQQEKLSQLARGLEGAVTGEQLARVVVELKGRLDALTARLDDPDYRLKDWVQSHAIFFGDDASFRDGEAVGALLRELYALLVPSKAKLRIIGYTDPTGTKEGNDALAIQRAERVVRELVAMGAPRDRLKALGRPGGALLSFDKGPNSSNRRVEFELAYAEEPIDATGEPLKSSAARPEGRASR
jgi:outer membrane protein OmpA-like peptidoglycan-associated protein